MGDEQRALRVERMGRVGYGPMLALQHQRHEQVLAGEGDDTLFLLEHEPVITLGRNSGDDHVLASRARLADHGVELYETGRGGDVTFHGPGQIVGYAIVHLREYERDVRRFVASLEEIMIRAAADFNVEAKRVDGLRGIWAGDAKLGAVGVRIANWTTMHGFALNVSAGIDGFALIVPCGLHGRAVTSLADIVGHPVAMAEVEDRLHHHAGVVLDRRALSLEPSPLPAVQVVSGDVVANEVYS
jgi:lipoate-protein ligase B